VLEVESNMIRSVLSVLAGYLVNVVGVSTFFAFVLFALFGGIPKDPGAFHPPGWLYAAELLSAPVIAVAGGYVCAWLAKRREMVHGAALAALMLVLGLATFAFDAGKKPLWSTAGVVVLGVLGALFGAFLRSRRVA
jgi:hypothetical protein